MPKRPTLSESSFLAHLFHPKKSAQPTGLRKTSLRATADRNRRRVNAFNRMSAAQQEVLKRSGQREQYLKGETTLAKAKASLREKAIQLGVAKPVKPRTPKPKAAPVVTDRRARLEAIIQQHLRNKVVDAGRNWNQRTSDQEIVYLEPDESMLGWDYGRIRYEGRAGSDYETFVDGHRHNPFWYH